MRAGLVTFILASNPFLILLQVGTSFWLILVIPLSGALIGAAHNIIIVRAQHIIFGGMALAPGLLLEFIFSTGAQGTFLSGYIADLLCFTPVFTLTGFISLEAAGPSFTLRE